MQFGYGVLGLGLDVLEVLQMKCGAIPTASKKRIIESSNNGVNNMTRNVYLHRSSGLCYTSQWDYYDTLTS